MKSRRTRRGEIGRVGLATVLALGLVLSLRADAAAQELSGIVMRPDSTPVSGAMVELHRVTEESGALLDSTRSDPRGRFFFTLPEVETGALFVAGVRHQGVLYWGPPVHSTVQPEVANYPVFVVDAVAVQEPDTDLRTSIRHVVITPTPNAIQVEEIIDVGGHADRTLVPAADSVVVWRGGLARGARGLVVAAGGVPEEDVVVLESGIGFRGALPPSGIRLVVQYFVPSLEYELTVEHSTGRLEVLAVPSSRTVFQAVGLTEAPTGGEMRVPVRRFTASDLSVGGVVTLAVSFEEPGRNQAWIWFLAALGLGAAALISVRLRDRGA